MLQRNLLYTAVTRGKKLVILLGNFKGLGMTVKRVEANRRITSLKENLVDLRNIQAIHQAK
ncbi:MAG: hypothetical protein A2287_05210 [Candidatus Melainabacteria bacterium RIFOXYA12_FULL_32_12]|nr:MAG: hypothetical protein A2287_05210 [Candidatus Melainabacteria bacterium RIFOXYA12_FULL_32_12]